MQKITTKGITVAVESKYEERASNPDLYKYIFSYQVMIENNSDRTVQLIDRHWIIMDADNVMREVKGPGVIGQQPILAPGEYHTYSSWSVIKTPIGKMTGLYNMKAVITDEMFSVEIPEFKLIADFVYN